MADVSMVIDGNDTGRVGWRGCWFLCVFVFCVVCSIWVAFELPAW
jgi:hypothetical protein